MIKNNILAAGVLLTLAAALLTTLPPPAYAASAQEIDIKVDAALDRFYDSVPGGKDFAANAKGMLVFPGVIKAGFGVGGEYGEGALRIGGKSVDYYSTAAASIGLQFGAQAKSIILVFLDEEALNRCRRSDGWEVGVDGSVALIELGARTSIDSTAVNQPVVGFVFGNKGLMYNLTLEGSKYTKLKH